MGITDVELQDGHGGGRKSDILIEHHLGQNTNEI
jgi:hypothetical protein